MKENTNSDLPYDQTGISMEPQVRRASRVTLAEYRIFGGTWMTFGIYVLGLNMLSGLERRGTLLEGTVGIVLMAYGAWVWRNSRQWASSNDNL